MRSNLYAQPLFCSENESATVIFYARPCCRLVEAQCESISVIWARSGTQRVSCCTGCRCGPLWCNGRYLLLTHSPNTISALAGGNPCLCHVPCICSICQCVSVSPLSSAHTHTHTLLSSSSRFLIFSGERENEFRSVVCSHGCSYQYLHIDLASPLLLHSSRYRLVFPAGICA